jgi:hypothetical protein
LPAFILKQAQSLRMRPETPSETENGREQSFPCRDFQCVYAHRHVLVNVFCIPAALAFSARCQLSTAECTGICAAD